LDIAGSTIVAIDKVKQLSGDLSTRFTDALFVAGSVIVTGFLVDSSDDDIRTGFMMSFDDDLGFNEAQGTIGTDSPEYVKYGPAINRSNSVLVFVKPADPEIGFL